MTSTKESPDADHNTEQGHPERMAENFAITDLALGAGDMAGIAALDTGCPAFSDHSDPARVKWL